MKSWVNSRTLSFLSSTAVAVGAVALVNSCGGGGGGDGPAETQGTIDATSVTQAINDLGGLVTICKTGAAGAPTERPQAQRVQPLALVPSIVRGAMAKRAVSPLRPTERAKALTSTPPPDQLGDCGGRYGYRNYVHNNGVTTATLAFENYCNSSTGERLLVNGGIAFVNTATPTATGPITTKLEASTSAPMTLATQTSTGTPISSQTMAFSNFKMAVGVPGGAPTATNPDLLTMESMSVTASDTGKTRRLANLSISEFQNNTGNIESTVGLRNYRSDGSYTDMTTTQPIVLSAAGDVVGGQVKFSGANGTSAVATAVPGPTLQATVSVNGAPLTSVPACAP
jgi:hypothetical protein